MAVQLLRNSRVFASTVTTGFTKENTKEILVQDDFDFSVGSNSTDISVNEAGPRPMRGSKRFNDSLNPAEWSFSTYLLPILDKTTRKVSVPDYMLWHALASGKPLDLNSKQGFHSNEINAMVNFTESAYHELDMLQLYVNMDGGWYHIKRCQVNQAEISIDIDGIGMTSWSGNGTEINKLDAAPFDVKALGITPAEFADLQDSYIVNKLTIMHLQDNDNKKTVYDIPVTGGSFTIENGITYLTPSTIGYVDKPIGSFTGGLNISGNITAYLNNRKAGSEDLFKDILKNLSPVNSYKVSFVLGGEYEEERPAVILVAPKAILSVPTIEIDDVLSTQVEFKAQPTELDSNDPAFFGFSPIFTKERVKTFIERGDAKTDTGGAG